MNTIIRNARIIDGTGKPAYVADVAIKDEKIAAIGDLTNYRAEEEIDASNLTLIPGLIDVHTHSDAFILIEPMAPSKLMQGVTTEICGQCGGSAAPRLNGAKLPSDWEDKIFPEHNGVAGNGPNWTTVADYRSCFEAAKPAINMILFSGHNTIRKGVLGDAPRNATQNEIAEMGKILQQALEEGAWGLTTGLVYHPGIHATPDEVLTLAKKCAECGGFYASHIRSEGDELFEAIDEVLNIVRKTGIRTEISHLKTSGKKNWNKIDSLIKTLEQARADGLPIHADRYPYLSAGTDLDIILPDWAAAGGNPAILKNLDDETSAKKIIDELNNSERDPASIMIGGTIATQNQKFTGKTVKEIMESENLTFGETIVKILKSDRTRTGAFFFGMCDDNLSKILDLDWVMAGSDASLRSPTGQLGRDFPHPRAYGTHPAFYRYLTQKLHKSEECAIHRMTGLAADAFGIKNRGKILENHAADIVLLNLENWKTDADYQTPAIFAKGVTDVFVNGSRVMKNRILNPSAPRKGKFLTRE